MKGLKDLHHGKLTLSANEYTVMYLLPLIPLFRARHPHIKIEVKRSLASRIASEILGRETEIGIVSFRPNDPTVTAVPVLMDELALIVPPDHPLADKKDVSVRELGAESFIAHNVSSPYRERVVRTFEKYRTPLNISLEMPTLEAIKRFVEQGMGVALVPRLTAQTEIARGQVVAVDGARDETRAAAAFDLPQGRDAFACGARFPAHRSGVAEGCRLKVTDLIRISG